MNAEKHPLSPFFAVGCTGTDAGKFSAAASALVDGFLLS